MDKENQYRISIETRNARGEWERNERLSGGNTYTSYVILGERGDRFDEIINDLSVDEIIKMIAASKEVKKCAMLAALMMPILDMGNGMGYAELPEIDAEALLTQTQERTEEPKQGRRGFFGRKRAKK